MKRCDWRYAGEFGKSCRGLTRMTGSEEPFAAGQISVIRVNPRRTFSAKCVRASS